QFFAAISGIRPGVVFRVIKIETRVTAMLDLTDNERLALAVELRRITDDAPSPGSFRIRTLKGILDKLALPLPRPPLPRPKPYAPPKSMTANRRRLRLG